MHQTNSIWIVENLRQLESIQTLRPKLLYKDCVLEEDCDIQLLSNYDMVFFLLTPRQVGNKFFINAINEILKVRKSSKTIFFAIDDINRLDEKESYKLILELKESVKKLIPNPVIVTVSSYYAALLRRYKNGEITIEEIRQNREVMIPIFDGEYLTGRQIMEENLEQLSTVSKMDKLYQLVDDLSSGIESTGIDVSKKNWLVLGMDQAGKSIISELLQDSLGQNLHFIDKTPEITGVNRYYDGMIIVVDLEIQNSFQYLENIYSTYIDVEKIIVVNKMDDFMFSQKSRQELQFDINKKIKSLTSDPIYFVSAYYYNQYLLLEREEQHINEVIGNPEIVLIDALQLPISKSKSKNTLPELLLAQSGFDNLLHYWE